MQELFSIHVILHETHSLVSAKGQVNMVLFDGNCRSDFFSGRILPGGVDTQRFPQAALSARYMLEGADDRGTPTRIFIENNGEFLPGGGCATRPEILTDNPRLAWLEETPLRGTITSHPQGVDIHFFREE